MKRIELVSLLLRLSLAFSFIYVAIASFITPNNWIGFIPDFLPGNFITRAYYLTFFSFYEVLLGLWLLSNKKTFYAAILSSATLFAITITNISAMDIVFRDVSLFLAAVALTVLTKRQ